MKMKKKEGKRNIVFKEQDKILEEKRKNMAEIANLKLNLKKILLSLQNKKKIILNLNDEKYCILHWLTILLENREFDTYSALAYEAKEYLLNNFRINYSEYDIIIGYRADDSYFSFAKDFINGTISYRQLTNAMYLGKLGQQIVLKSKKAFDKLTFIRAEVASNYEWFEKKMNRNKQARREYFDIERNKRQKGDIYIMNILDEEMKENDLRLR